MKQEVKSRILLSTLERIKSQGVKGLAEQHYARNNLGRAVGIHSADATIYDLAGALFLACEHHALNEREVYFYQLWREVRTASNQMEGKDATFCSWLDKHSLKWHVELLERMLVVESSVEAEPTTTKTKVNLEDWI